MVGQSRSGISMNLAHRLPDVLASGLRVVFCGTAAGAKSAAVGAYYAGPGNAFWPTLHLIGLTPRRLLPAEFATAPQFGIGLTDIVKYCAGNDAVLANDDFDAASVIDKIRTFAPRILAFNGKRAAAAFHRKRTGDVFYGRQRDSIGSTIVWVLPSTSGAARSSWDIAHWHAVASASVIASPPTALG